MVGFLGFVGWKVTVISSNFIALMLILTMAMNIHMSTRYLQLSEQFPHKHKFEILILTTRKMIWPIFYTVLTTICAFMSLIFSEIKPIIDFGWMMTFGLITSLLITFTLLPTLLSFIQSSSVALAKKRNLKITNYLGNLALDYKNYIFGLTGIIILLSIFGISKLEVENSFINYFSKKTEIYQGMKLIDEKLGGTTPLEVILKFPISKDEEKDAENDWGDEEENDEKYWFTRDKMDRITRVHNYLDNIEAIGKVLSFSSIIEVATKLNNNKPLGTLEMGVLYTKIPDTIKKEIIDPYISIKDSEARISLRIKDSLDGLRRNELINKINFDLENKLNIKKDEFKLGGVLILFNNLLQSLFKSQILTLGLVF
jgi:predicted RND superfamily exporter protein